MAPAETGWVHELALTESVVQTVLERIVARPIVRVRLRVGRLVAVMPEAMRFCFDVCTTGTALEGAALEIDDVPARIVCRSCGAESELADVIALCPCGSADVLVQSGNELEIEEVEVG